MRLLDSIRATLERSAPRCLRFAYLFGSAATGSLRPDSDIDLAVDCGGPLSLEDRERIAGLVEAATGRAADVVDLQGANAEVRMQVLRSGLVAYSIDERARAEFEMYTPSIYEDFRREREVLERALIERIRR